MTYQYFERGDTPIEYGDCHDQMYIVIDGEVDIVVDFETNKLQDKELPEVAQDLGVCGRGLIGKVKDFKIKAGLNVDQQLMKDMQKSMATKITQLFADINQKNSEKLGHCDHEKEAPVRDFSSVADIKDVKAYTENATQRGGSADRKVTKNSNAIGDHEKIATPTLNSIL